MTRRKTHDLVVTHWISVRCIITLHLRRRTSRLDYKTISGFKNVSSTTLQIQEKYALKFYCPEHAVSYSLPTGGLVLPPTDSWILGP